MGISHAGSQNYCCGRILMRYQEIINELIWDDSHTAAQAARKYPNAWIHFSKIPKLGINPRKGHRDPPGVYFYPCRWLLSDDAWSLHTFVHHIGIRIDLLRWLNSDIGMTRWFFRGEFIDTHLINNTTFQPGIRFMSDNDLVHFRLRWGDQSNLVKILI